MSLCLGTSSAGHTRDHTRDKPRDLTLAAVSFAFGSEKSATFSRIRAKFSAIEKQSLKMFLSVALVLVFFGPSLTQGRQETFNVISNVL